MAVNVILFNTLLIVACGYAWLRGGAPERIVATAFATAAAATYLTRWLGRDYQSVEFSVLAIDLLLLAALMLVALKANRYWPIWVASLHLIAVAIHGTRAYLPDLPNWMYQWAVQRMAYPMLVLLVIGTWRHRRRLARGLPEPPWNDFSLLPRR